MKRLILFAAAITTAIGLSAQVQLDDAQQYKVHLPDPDFSFDKFDANGKKAPYAPKQGNGEKSLGERVLGETTYDLQTNSAVQNRIAMNSSGEISVVWTASEGNNPFDDRGSGYAHYDPTNDVWTKDASYPRIESDRSGWPSILYDGAGGEHVISHSTASNRVRINSRSTIGSGSWSQKDVSTAKLVWNRAAMGGTDGNTIHMVAVMNDDKGGDSVNYQMMSTPLLYYRSQDAGQTWDIIDSILPGLDSAGLGTSRVLSGDCYSIIADGNNVAIGIYAPFNDVILMESDDNGNTWTKTIVYDYPYRGYQDFKNRASDSVYYMSADGSGSVIYDNNGVVHLAYSRVYRTNNFAGGTSFLARFPDQDTTVHYRNSTPPYFGRSANHVGDTIPRNPKIAFYGGSNVNTYGTFGYGNDSIYYVWSGIHDSIVSGIDPDVGMRQIYLIKSGDGGESWTEPLQLTVTDPQFSENVYPDIYDVVDDKIRVVFQRDAYPSCYVTSLNYNANTTQYVQTSLSDNQIIYLEIDLGGGGIGIGIEENLSEISEMGVYPNPSHGQIDLNVILYREMNVTVNVTNISGQVVHTYNGSPLVKGSNKLQMDLSHLEPGVYTVNIYGGGSIMNKKVVIK